MDTSHDERAHVFRLTGIISVVYSLLTQVIQTYSLQLYYRFQSDIQQSALTTDLILVLCDRRFKTSEYVFSSSE